VDYRRRAQLLHAGWSGNASRIKDLDRHDVTEVPDKDGHDALKWAVANLHFEFAQTLLSFANARAFLHPVDDLNWESIHYACSNGDADMITLLLESGLNVDSGMSAHGPGLRPNSIVSPIHLAAASPASLEAVQVWNRKAKASLEIKDNRGSNAMHWAVESNHVPTMKYLKEEGLKIDAATDQGTRPIHIASERGYVDVVQWLIRGGANASLVYGDGYLPVHLAAQNGHLGVIQYLRDGAGVTVVGSGAPSKETGSRPLHFAAQQDRMEVVRYLMQVGEIVDPLNKNSETPLHLAAEEGHIEVVRYLIEKGADVEAKTGKYERPMHRAARRNRVDVVRYLIQRGASVNPERYVPNNSYWTGTGNTPLQMAAGEGHDEVIRVLKESGADLENKNNVENRTALHLAALKGHFTAARELKSLGANLTTKDMFGDNASMLARHNGHIELAEELAPPKLHKKWFKRLFDCTHHFPDY
jgi:ankyrin repeat protein